MPRFTFVAPILSILAGCGSDGKMAQRPDPGTIDAAVEAGHDTGRMDVGDGAASPGQKPDASTTGISVASTPNQLSAWHLFTDLPTLAPAEGVIPYDMRSPLFTDYAHKQRFMYVPRGTQIAYSERDAWRFPVGAILVKDFSYPVDAADPGRGLRHIETRLIIHREEGWVPEVYVWNEAQTDAVRDVTGETLPVTRKTADGHTTTFDYGVPSRSECRKCHGTTPPIEGAQATRTLGPMTGQLNLDRDYGQGPVNQIDHLAALGLLDRQPAAVADRVTFPFPDDETAGVAERARAYLSANCAHCHAKGGEVFDKDLWLDWESTQSTSDPYTWGVCKKPTSAGNAECEAELDIIPGHPEESLLVCRMASLGKGRMAPLGRNLVHVEGLALVRAWIAGLDLPSCSAP